MPDKIKDVAKRVWSLRPVRILLYTTTLGALGYALTPEQATALDAIILGLGL